MNVARSSHLVGNLLQKGRNGMGIFNNRPMMMMGAGLDQNRFFPEASTPAPVPAFATRAMATRARSVRGSHKKKTNTMTMATSSTPLLSRVTEPTLEIAQAMPLSTKEMANSELVVLGAMGNSDANKEILVRHIMSIDKVPYDDAMETFKKIAHKNREGMWLLTIPYKIGIGVAITAAFASFPMVFDINTVTWFNEHFVTADIPEPKDLETPLEVGSWSWNWMEPPLGQISFFLLCLQYTRSQVENIGIRPYTQKVMSWRAEKLANTFPQYDAEIIMAFSESISFYHEKHGIKFGGHH